MTKHAEVAASADVREAIPALAELAEHDRRSGRAQPRHDRRLDRQQRPGGGLSRRLPGARRDDRHQQAQDRRGGVLHGPLRDGPRGRRDHHQVSLPGARTRRPTRSSATRPRAMPWSASSSPSAPPRCRVAVTGAGANGVFRWAGGGSRPEEPLRAEVARRPRRSRPRASTATSTPTPTIAPTSSASWPAAPPPPRRSADGALSAFASSLRDRHPKRSKRSASHLSPLAGRGLPEAASLRSRRG